MRFRVLKGKTRIDKFLSSKIVNKSRSFIQKLIKDGKVLVGGKKVNAGYTVREQDVISVNMPKEKKELRAEKRKINIVYEDEDILVVDKPKGIAVHPKEGENSGTLVNSLLEKMSLDIDNERPGIVHRLDKDTTGLLLVAKNQNSLYNLKEQFKKREVEKRYLVLIYGHLNPKKGEINIPIGRDEKARTKMRAKNNGKPSKTKYEIAEYFDHFGEEFTLLEAMLLTGRTHQIRVHFESIGHPVVGDKIYTTKKYLSLNKKICLGRQFLHAYKLGFHHPITKKWMGFKSELPKDLSEVLKELRG